MGTRIRDLVHDLLPTAPELGLFVEPDIPADKLGGALGDYAKSVNSEEVIALFDATYSGTAKDGIVFTDDRLVFQNHDWSPVQEISYDDIVDVVSKKKFLSGRKIYVDVNKGRATVTVVVDFSGKPKAADYVTRFLHEAMMTTIAESSEEAETTTDIETVARTLNRLWREGKLSESDLKAIMAVINGS